ncbi:MAG TPA: methyltransferase domain-containing protein [Candidatus Limnocylindrales bacterium]|nr:methyltransferase domain-containing protein [Candidatus Limnocylindrales bacterium]
MPSTFNARDAVAYDRLMGRWSRRLAPLFAQHAGIVPGDRLLEVGCGTGSLTFALAETAPFAELTAVDYADVYVEAARAVNRDSRVRVEQGDAVALVFADASFDRTLSLLLLHLVPQPDRAVAEMRRVTRPGGVVAAAVWDAEGGVVAQRIFWDTAAVLDPGAGAGRARAMGNPVVAPGGLRRLFIGAGLVDVEERPLSIRMEPESFADYWGPYASGEGPIGAYVAGLRVDARARLEEHLRAAYLAGRTDGPRSFTAVAWSCRGLVPLT